MKKRSKKILAVLLTAGLVASPSMSAWASTEGNTAAAGSGSEAATVVESVTVLDTEKQSVDSVENHNVSYGVMVCADGNATVTGDVSVNNDENAERTNGYGILVAGGTAGSVNVGGNISVDSTENDSQPDAAFGITTYTGTTIEVGKNVEVKNKDDATGIQNYNQGNADVNIHVAGNAAATSTNTEYGKYFTAYGVVESSTGKSTITIDGNVTADSKGSRASGVFVYNDPSNAQTTTVTIGKGVNATSASNSASGVYVTPGRTTELYVNGGGIQASGTDAEGLGIYDDFNNDGVYDENESVKINVTGDIRAAASTGTGNAVRVNTPNGNVAIVVDGDITGTTSGIYVKNNFGKIDIDTSGTISSEKGAAIQVDVTVPEAKAADVPEITVWKIESGTDNLVASNDTDYASKVQSAINYIIKGSVTEDGKDTSNGKIKLTGTKGTVTIGGTTYETAHQDDEITINVETVSGYKYSLSNGQALLTANADGSYTIKVPARGGVDLKAVLEKIVEQKKSSSGSDSDDSGSSGSGTASSAASAGTTTIVGEPAVTTVTTADGATATTTTVTTAEGSTITTTTSGAATVTTTTDVTGVTVVTATVELKSGKEVSVSGASVSAEGTLASGLVCNGPSPVVALTGASKTADLPATVAAAINAIDAGNLAAVPVATEGKSVLAPTVALSGVEAGTKLQLVMTASKVPASGSVQVLYFDKATGSFIIIAATVDPVTGIVTFTAPGDGTAAIIG